MSNTTETETQHNCDYDMKEIVYSGKLLKIKKKAKIKFRLNQQEDVYV